MFQGYTQGTIDFLWGLTLNNERPWFQAHKEEFLALVDKRGEFVLDNDLYKRPKGDPGPLLYPWYNGRRISFSRECNCEGVFFTPELAAQVLEGWKSLAPQYRFLCSLPGDPEPEGM